MQFHIVYPLSLAALITGSILFFRVYIRREYQRVKRLTQIPSILQALLFFTWGGWPSLYLPREWPVTHVSTFLRLIGQAGISFGLVVLIGGMIWLGIKRSFGIETGGLNVRGFYTFSRNPQILGCALYLAAFILLWPSWYALAWGLSLAIILHQMVIIEEQHLREIFGSDYERYYQAVPRYLGFSRNILNNPS